MPDIWERIVRGLGVLTVAGFLITAMTPLSNVVGRRIAVASHQLQPADAIVVLGAGVMGNGTLDSDSLRRVIAGIQLYKKGLAPIVVLSGSGMGPGTHEETEAQMRTGLAESMGVPPAAIIKEETANTTFEESIHISAALHARGAGHILLVTDSLHMRRAMRVFAHAGLDVQPAVSADYPAALTSPQGRLWLAMRIAQESAAMIYYRLAGYI